MNKLRYAFISLIVVLSFACGRKYNEDYLAPEMKVASSNFTIVDNFKANYFNGRSNKPSVTGIVDSISFQKDSTFFVKTKLNVDSSVTVSTPHFTHFLASFNERVTWTIKIQQFSKLTGKLSGAEKELSGLSRYSETDGLYHIDSLNSIWNGNSDGFAYFKSGDSAIATLSILGSEKTQTILFVIAKSTYYSPSEAILLNDFEGGFSQVPYVDGSDPIPTPLPDVTTRIKAPQGNSSFVIEGTDNNGDYFVGGLQQVLPSNVFVGKKASDIYFNMYIYGFGADEKLTPNATKLNIGTSEDDNGNGSFEAKSEDTFEQQVNVDWVGWKLISVRYSNLKQSTSRDNGGSGNNIIEPDKSVSLNVNLISSPNGSRVGTALDYVIITYGKPYSK